MGLIKWLGLKVYQYELTLGLYMLEPWEKSTFNAIVLLFVSLFFYTCFTYIPTYASYVVQKVQYYVTDSS
ncbi:hypothetical protein HDU97_004218 [Phlyctochytrium planicorne]|nr:hypothetical protein HDU97_004218 [Phlyctochytrium planicorne]